MKCYFRENSLLYISVSFDQELNDMCF